MIPVVIVVTICVSLRMAARLVTPSSPMATCNTDTLSGFCPP
jgi:hypothetical protein